MAAGPIPERGGKSQIRLVSKAANYQLKSELNGLMAASQN
jgi:hypothetical protein